MFKFLNKSVITIIIVLVVLVIGGILFYIYFAANFDVSYCNNNSGCVNTCCGCISKIQICARECFVLPVRSCECVNNKCIAVDKSNSSILSKKAAEEIEETEKRFKDENGEIWRININPYTGLLDGAYDLNFKESDSFPNKEEVVGLAQQFLSKNKDYFGLSNFRLIDNPNGWTYPDTVADLLIEPEQDYEGIYIYSSINGAASENESDREYFKNRVVIRYDEKENSFTNKPHIEINIYGVTIYPNIKVVSKPKINEEEAIELIYGYEHEWVSWGRTQVQKFEKGKDFLRAKRLVILPWENEEKNKLEFKLAWQIESANSISDLEAGVSIWTIYVDASDEKVIYIRQNFKT